MILLWTLQQVLKSSILLTRNIYNEHIITTHCRLLVTIISAIDVDIKYGKIYFLDGLVSLFFQHSDLRFSFGGVISPMLTNQPPVVC